METQSSYGLRYVPPVRPLASYRLRRTARANLRTLVKGQNAARVIIDVLADHALEDSSLRIDEKFYSVSFALLAFLADLNLTIIALTRTRVPSERHLLLRVICLHLYEASSLANRFNQTSRELIELRSGDRPLFDRAAAIFRQLNQFSGMNSDYLKPIRRWSIAHREEFGKFIVAAESVDEVRIIGMTTSFLDRLHDLPDLLTACSELSHANFQRSVVERAVSRARRIGRSGLLREQ